MKITDIQIGDWLQNTNGNIGKAQAIYRYPDYEKEYEKDEFRYEVVMEYSPNSTCYSELSLLKPIPLTAEILEKNGYKMFALNEDEAVGFCGKWWSNDGDVMVKKFKFEYMGDMFYMSARNSKISNIRSVHQFQHALRLVGVDKEIEL